MNVQVGRVATNKDYFPTESGAFLPLLVAYKTDSIWKAFVNPYGETTEADSKEEAVAIMRGLTKAYKEAAEEYDNPKHLVYAGLGNLEDREVFAHVIANQDLMRKVAHDGKVDLDNIYVEAYRD